MAKKISTKALRGMLRSKKTPKQLKAFARKELKSRKNLFGKRRKVRAKPKTSKRKTKRLNITSAKRRTVARRRRKKAAPKSFYQKIPSPVKAVLEGFLYGAVIKGPTERVGAGLGGALGTADNVGRMGVLWAANKFIPIPMVRSVAKKALFVEGNALGEGGVGQLFDIFGGNGGSSGNTGGAVVVG